jgi:hypothetical protein
MRWMLGVLALLLQAAPLPPAYPRQGATKVFENARVQVWDIAWLKQQYPLHRHIYDLVGVYYSPGDRIIISEDGSRRPVSTKAWDTAFQKAGVTHIEQGASDSPLRAVFIEFKQAAPLGERDVSLTTPSFPAGEGKQLVNNERTTAWEFAPPSVSWSPHRHAIDAVVVSFRDQKPHVTFVPHGTFDAYDGDASADRVYVFELK